MNQDRYSQTKQNLFKILTTKGTIYTLGLCMGILCRLTKTDYNLYKELEHRANKQ